MTIYIIGAPTAGKSTLAKMIKTRFPMVNQLSFEAVRNGFIKAQPSLEMNDRNSPSRKELLPEFLMEFASWNEKMTGNASLVEGTFAKASQIQNMLEDGDLLICLGYGGHSLSEIAEQAISKAKSDSYLHGHTTTEFMKHFYDLEADDTENREFCLAQGLPYFDTYNNREKSLMEALTLVDKHLRNAL